MATTDIIHLQAIRSKDVLSGSSANLDVAKHFDGETSPKLPTSEQLEYGDIALNIAKGYEVLSIKNYDGDIVYLPFNLSDRVLSLEGLQQYIVDNFASLSASVITFNELFNEEIKEQLNAFSAVTQDTVDALLADTYTQLKNDVDGYAITHAAAIARFNATLGFDTNGKYNFTVDYLSGRTVTNAIEAVDARIDEIEDLIELNNIRLNGDVSSKNAILLGKITDLSNHVNETNEEIYKRLDESISSLSAVTKGNFESTIESLKGEITSLGEKLSEKDSELSGKVQGYHDEVLNSISELDTKISETSGDIVSKYDTEIASINDKLNTLSGVTSDSIAQEVEIAKNELSEQIAEGDIVRAAAITNMNNAIGLDVHGQYSFDKDYLSGRTITNAIEAVDARIDEIESNAELFEARTNKSIQDLRNNLNQQGQDLTTLVNECTNEVIEYVDNLSAVTEGNFAEVVSGINKTIESVNNNINGLEQAISDVESGLTETINSQIANLSGTIETVSGSIASHFTNEIENIESILSDVSASTPSKISDEVARQVGESVSGFSKHLEESDLVRAAAIAKINNSVGLDGHGNCDFYSDYLSGRTIVDAIEALDLKIDYEAIKNDRALYALSSLTKSVEDKFDETVTTINAVDAKVDEEIANVYDNVEEALEVLSGSISTTIDEEISGVTDYINSSILAISEDIQAISGQIGSNISVQVEELTNNFNEFSAKTSVQYDNFTSGVTEQLANVDEKILAATSEIESSLSGDIQNVVERLENDAIVNAAAYAKLNSQFGFDRHGNYNSEFEALSGRTVAGAIDYLYEAWDDNDWKIDKTLRSIDGYDKTLEAHIKASNEKHQELEEKIGVGVDALSAETKSEINALSETLSSKIDSLSAASTSDLDTNINEVKDIISGVQEDLLGKIEVSYQIENELSATTQTLTETTYQLSGNVQSALSYVDNVVENVNQSIDEVLSGLSDTNNNVEDLREELHVTEIVRAAAVANINRALGFDVHGNYVPYAEELSGRTITDAIEYLNTQAVEDRDYFDANVEELTRKLNEHDINVADYFSGVTKDIADLRKIANDSHLEIVTQHTKDIAALSGSVHDNAVALKIECAQSLEKAEERMKDNILSVKDEINEDFQEFSAATTEFVEGFEDRIVGLSGGIEDAKSELYNTIDDLDEKVQEEFAEVSATTDSIQDNIEDDELVHASAFVKLRNVLGLTNDVKFNPYADGMKNRNMTDAMDYLHDYIQEVEDKVEDCSDRIEAAGALHMKTVTYETLRRMARSEHLEAGQYYKILNYQATVSESLSANTTTRLAVVASDTHTNSGFYIIVHATGAGTLSENASVIQVDTEEEDDYFSRNDVEAWNIKYCLYNDTARFNWANPKGFGVIYYMKDEFGNEANYDFKNIMFIKSSVPTFTFHNKTNNTDLSLTNKARNNIIKGVYTDDGKLQLNYITLTADNIASNIFTGDNKYVTLSSSAITDLYYGYESTYDYHKISVSELTGEYTREETYTEIAHKTVNMGASMDITIDYDNHTISYSEGTIVKENVRINEDTKIYMECSVGWDKEPIVTTGDNTRVTIESGTGSSNPYPSFTLAKIGGNNIYKISHNHSGNGVITLYVKESKLTPITVTKTKKVRDAAIQNRTYIISLQKQIAQLTELVKSLL